MASITAAGTSIAISSGTPATQDASGFGALTYVEIGQVEKLGTIGAAFAKVEFQPLKGVKQKHKGAADYGSLQPSMAYDEADAGQALLRVAAADATVSRYAFRVTLPTGAIRYFLARVFGAPENVDGADSILMSMPTVEISSKVVQVGATASPAPAFTAQPTISPTSGPAGTTFTASDGAASNATSYTRRWLLGTTAIGTGTTVTPNAAGSLTLEVTASGPGGTKQATSSAVTVAAAPAPTPGTVRTQATDRSAGPQATTNVTNGSSNTQIGDQMSFVMLRDDTELVVTEGNFHAPSAGATSLNGLSAVTYRRSIYDGTTYYPLTKNGSRDMTVQPGAVADWDAVSITAKKGQALLLIGLKTFAAAPASFPGSTVPFSNARDLSEQGTALTDRTLTGGFTAATRVSTAAILPPISIRGAARTQAASVCILGDSITAAGASDADTNRSERGYAARALFGAGIPFVVSGQTSLKAVDVASSSALTQQYLAPAIAAGVTHIYLALGINDAQTRTAAQIYADVQTIAAAAKSAIPGVKVVLSTLTPKTNAANTGQSGSDTTTWATRLSYNATVRSNNGIGDGYFDAASFVQSSADANLWRSDLLTATSVTVADGGINNQNSDLVETDIGLVVLTGGGTTPTAVSIRGGQGGGFLVAPSTPALEEARQPNGTTFTTTPGSGLKVNVTGTGAVPTPTDGLHPTPGMHSFVKQQFRAAIPALFSGAAPASIIGMTSANTSKYRAASARTDRGANIVVLGTSIARGQSTGAGTAQATSAWPMQLPARMRANGAQANASNFFGNANGWSLGTSAANFLSGESRVGLTGTAAPTSFNTVGGNGFVIPAGSTITFAPQDNATKADIWWRDNSAGKSFSWSVDGGTATTVASTGATTPQKTTISLGAAGLHSITLAQVAGSPQIIGVHAYDDTGTKREANVLNWGLPGATSTQMLGDTETTAGRQAMLAAVAPDLTILEGWGVNDWRQSVPIDTLKSNLGAAIALAKQTGDVLVTTPIWDNGTSGATAQQDSYAAAVVDVANTAGVPLLDIRAAWKSYADGSAAGWYSDTVHPTASGYAAIANAVEYALRQARLLS